MITQTKFEDDRIKAGLDFSEHCGVCTNNSM